MQKDADIQPDRRRQKQYLLAACWPKNSPPLKLITVTENRWFQRSIIIDSVIDTNENQLRLRKQKAQFIPFADKHEGVQRQL